VLLREFATLSGSFQRFRKAALLVQPNDRLIQLSDLLLRIGGLCCRSFGQGLSRRDREAPLQAVAFHSEAGVEQFQGTLSLPQREKPRARIEEELAALRIVVRLLVKLGRIGLSQR